MAFARLNDEGRIIEWCRDKLEDMDTEFSNPDYINENCINGIEDFIIENGLAKFSPKPEKEIASLKKNLADTDYITAKVIDSLASCDGVTGILSVLASFKGEYGEKIKKRQEWRERINELEGGE